jgi:hypothetical protein
LSCPPANRCTGATMVEMLLALPVVLLLGLGVAQFALVYQAKHALDYALTQAVRQGTVQHASAQSIELGLAAGLVPYLYGADDWTGVLQAEARAVAHVRSGLAAGWIVLRQRSPGRESFDDWAEPATDPMGEAIPGLVEIANDNLDNRRLRMQPASGVAAMSGPEAIGRRSGQTLADANVLRLELVYGVRLVVPVVGSLVIRTLARWNDCAAPGMESPSIHRLGLLPLPEVAPDVPGPMGAAWMCGFLLARDGAGRAAARIPIRASATMRMMSPARLSTMTQARVDVASGRSSTAPAPLQAPVNPPASGSGSNVPTGIIDLVRQPIAGPPSAPRAAPPIPLDNGFLAIGSDRAYPAPSTHPALCDG